MRSPPWTTVDENAPPADADLLRGQIKARHDAIEDSQGKFRAAQNTIRAMLRKEPFDIAAVEDAMAKARVARQNFDQSIQGAFASYAAQMSPTGRQALADWPPGRKTAGKSQ